MRPDTIEFYDGKSLLASVDSSIIPPVGAKISIRKKTWKIVSATFAVDYSDDPYCRGMRCNIDVVKA
ncbi:hypothetical protein KKA14_02605 [bacterium]|nr:hypothetical protein [bacterium]